MTDYACPSCGAPVSLRSSLSVSAVCPYCQSLVVRRDVDLETIGKVADLPDDMSPFQLGTEAHDGDVAVSLIGRLRMAWSDGFWNEWFFAAADGRRGWLAEAQGTYAFSYELAEPPHAQTRDAITRWVEGGGKGQIVGRTLTLGGTTYTVTDTKKAICLGCEGELPIVSPHGRRTLSFDLMGGPDEFATIEVSGDERRIFTGRYVEWDDLRASNLKPVEGWS